MQGRLARQAKVTAIRAFAKGAGRARYLLAASTLLAGASVAQPVAMPDSSLDPVLAGQGEKADLSVMTYNVKGLPWPVAWGRDEAMQRIAERLAAMRRRGRQPAVVVLQEAFTSEAKAIGRLAGYPYQVQGPYLRAQAGTSEGNGGHWYRGETQASALDSGLVILSDLPILSVERAAFPTGACAGYDCMAAKGIVMATVELPGGRGAVTIATTHLNSRAASGVSFKRTHEAYRKQVAFLARFLASHRAPDRPLILAGDFNRGLRPARVAALAMVGGTMREASDQDVLQKSSPADAAWIRRRARDMQFYSSGSAMRLDAAGMEVPFGTEPDGSMISDHMGFTVDYRLTPRPNAI